MRSLASWPEPSETEPLLQSILDGADVGILNCEAGSLFLVDETTDELVFKATAGPVAHNLLDSDWPQALALSAKPSRPAGRFSPTMFSRPSTWFPATDETTGFITRSILAVPMQVKESIIGVLEVINRKDGLPFVDDDQNLLSAFGGQAAVAIDNARLYTLTDQELTKCPRGRTIRYAAY